MVEINGVRPELAHLAIPIGEVKNWPDNPRQGDIPKLKASLSRHGQYAPILVQDSTGHVVKGNNTLIAATELGWTEIAVQRLDLSDEQARRILLLDNKTSDDASYDERVLTALLAEFGQDELDDTGWSTAELDDLLRSTDTLGDAATAFLDDTITGADTAPDPTAAAATEPTETPVTTAATTPAEAGADAGEQYVQMSWTGTTDQRETVRAALSKIQKDLGLKTAIEGLVAMASFYLDRGGPPTTGEAMTNPEASA